MKFNWIKYRDCIIIKIEIDGVVHELGVLDKEEATKLRDTLQEAVCDIEYVMNI
jgi:hypothetical protein